MWVEKEVKGRRKIYICCGREVWPRRIVEVKTAYEGRM